MITSYAHVLITIHILLVELQPCIIVVYVVYWEYVIHVHTV